MNPKDQGLTVGELTMAIGALIVAGLIWTTFTKQNESSQNFVPSSELQGKSHLSHSRQG